MLTSHSEQSICESGDLLSGFQGDDDEDGSPVHAAHTAAVAHEIVKDGGKLSPHLKHKYTRPFN